MFSTNNEYFLLHDPAQCSLHEYLSDHNGKLSQQERFSFMLEIANTIAKMHANGIVHRNLLPSRLFVTSDKHISMIGFENPKIQTSSSYTCIRTVYAPPEASLNPNQVTPFYDIFALGILMYEIWVTTKMTGYKLNMSLLETNNAPAPLIALIVKCTDANPQNRCSIHEIVETLEKMYHSI